MVKPQQVVIGRRAEQRARGPERYSPHRRGGAKSFVDDLVLGRGVVLSRAATSLRSIETQPWTRRFVRFARRTLLFSWFRRLAGSFFFFSSFFPILPACQGPGSKLWQFLRDLSRPRLKTWPPPNLKGVIATPAVYPRSTPGRHVKAWPQP